MIAIVGWFRGLHGIEAFEVPAVDVELVVIAGLLAGMFVYAATRPRRRLERLPRGTRFMATH